MTYKKNTREYWEQIFKEHSESNLTIINFCKSRQIRPNIFYYWRDKFHPELVKRVSKKFTPLKLINQTASAQAPQINIHLITTNGTKLIIPENINCNSLKNLINIICG